jgi:hypothetical protein
MTRLKFILLLLALPLVFAIRSRSRRAKDWLEANGFRVEELRLSGHPICFLWGSSEGGGMMITAGSHEEIIEALALENFQITLVLNRVENPHAPIDEWRYIVEDKGVKKFIPPWWLI